MYYIRYNVAKVGGIRVMGTRRVLKRRPEGETPVSVRLEKSLHEAIRNIADRTGKPFSRVIKEMLEMALRMQRFPGIVFVEGPAGRRAHVAGTGLDVWEVIELLREYGSAPPLLEHFPGLSPMAMRIAEAYAQAYPDEIDAFLESNAQSSKQLRRALPWTEAV